MKMKNKHGWIRVVEAFVAVLIITGLVLVLLDEGYIKKNDPSEEVYKLENSILRDIQNNDTIRQEILSATVPVNTSSPSFPILTNQTIKTKIPEFLICAASICEIEDSCIMTITTDKNIYSRSVAITTDSNYNFNPRKLVLFCYRK